MKVTKILKVKHIQLNRTYKADDDDSGEYSRIIHIITADGNAEYVSLFGETEEDLKVEISNPKV